MPTIRNTDQFSFVPHELLNDPRLSWTAKGIAAFLHGKYDDSQPSVTDLLELGSEGLEEINAALDELLDVGYLVKSDLKKTGQP